MNDITALKQRLELAAAKGSCHTLLPDDCRALVEALEKAQQRIGELEKAATEPVAWTDEQELRDVERSGCGYLFTVNPITPNADPRRVIKLYTVPPALESRTVTVKLPEDITSASAPEVFEIAAEAERLGLRGTYASYAVGWNARGKADQQTLTAAGIQVIEGEGQ